ncbi:hypothetical protein MTP02_55370 [Streptomyces albus]|nr:hypothetical protein MTP02_55370 [Streptomyces albus]
MADPGGLAAHPGRRGDQRVHCVPAAPGRCRGRLSAQIKRAGRRALRKFQETVAQQQGITPETDRSGGNAFLLIAGLLLILPGLISDVFGLVLLLPPVRTALARRAERSLERRMAAAGPGTFGGAFQQARMRAPDGKVVQGEVVRDDEPPRPEGRDDDPRPPLTP